MIQQKSEYQSARVLLAPASWSVHSLRGFCGQLHIPAFEVILANLGDHLLLAVPHDPHTSTDVASPADDEAQAAFGVFGIGREEISGGIILAASPS